MTRDVRGRQKARGTRPPRRRASSDAHGVFGRRIGLASPRFEWRRSERDGIELACRIGLIGFQHLMGTGNDLWGNRPDWIGFGKRLDQGGRRGPNAVHIVGCGEKKAGKTVEVFGDLGGALKIEQ